MSKNPGPDWYAQWFNEDYLKLYSDHNEEEAKKQVAFLIHSLKLTGHEHVLDLGCGTGRHSIILAQLGCTVTGMDLSAVLIEKAKQKAALQPQLKLKFVLGDMRRMEHAEHFDLIISMFTSFGYFENDEENTLVLRSIHSVLKPHGRFFLDYLHPHDVRKHLIPIETKLIDGIEIVIERQVVKDQIVKTIHFPHTTYQEKVRLFSRDEMEKILFKSGLEILHVWNDYQGNPWKKEGERQLFLCKVALNPVNK